MSDDRTIVYKFNKPKGVITTMDDPKNRSCIAPFLARVPDKVSPVGRLDRDTSGLMLLTNDGVLANQIMHPSFQLSKTYQVGLLSKLTKLDAKRLIDGFFLEDGPVAFDEVGLWDTHTCEVRLSVGRNRIVKRAFDFIGNKVVSLKRLAVGPVLLGTLKSGEVSQLSPSELTALRRAFQ